MEVISSIVEKSMEPLNRSHTKCAEIKTNSQGKAGMKYQQYRSNASLFYSFDFLCWLLKLRGIIENNSLTFQDRRVRKESVVRRAG